MAHRLPTEIWTTIIEFFDSHALYWDSFEPEHIRRYKNDIRQLAIFCRVTKQLQEIAKPLLYRDVRLFGGDARLFVRTMECRWEGPRWPNEFAQQPIRIQVRRMAKRLSFEFEIERGMLPQPSDNDQWSMQRCYEEAIGNGMGRHVLYGHFPPVHEAADKWLHAWNSAVNDASGPTEDLVVILLFWLPAIRHLRLAFERTYDRSTGETSGIWKCKRLLQTLSIAHNNDVTQEKLREGDARTTLPVALINLKNLVLESPFPDDLVVQGYPTVFQKFIEAQALWTLPGLSKLTLCRFWSWHPLTPHLRSTVTHLTLKECPLDPGQLAGVLECFPLLQNLHYQVEGMWRLYRDERPLNKDFFADQDSRRLVAYMHPCRCPALQELEFLNIASYPRFADEAKAMIERMEREDAEFNYDPRDVWATDDDEDDGEEQIVTEPDLSIDPQTRFRIRMARYLKPVVLLTLTELRRARFHITDFDGWIPKSQVDLYVPPPRIAHVLPPSIESLTLVYSRLGGGGEGKNDACVCDEDNFESVRALIEDCRLACDAEGSVLAPKLHHITLEIRDYRCNDETYIQELRSLAECKGVTLQLKSVPPHGPLGVKWDPAGGCKAFTSRRLKGDINGEVIRLANLIVTSDQATRAPQYDTNRPPRT